MALLPPDPVYVARGNMGSILSLNFHVSPKFEHVYAGAESGKVHIWDLTRNREIASLDDFKEPCLAMHCTDNDKLITQRKGGTINIWQAHNSNWSVSKTIDTDYCGYCRSQMSMDDSMFIPLNDSQIALFSLKSLKSEIVLDIGESLPTKSLGMVMAIKPCMDESNYILASYDGGLMALWDTRNKKILSTLDVDQCPMCMDFNSSSMSGIIGSPSDNLQIFQLSSSYQLEEKKMLSLKNPGVSAVSIRPDLKLFASGGWDHQIRIYSWKSMKQLAVLDQHHSTIQDLVHSRGKIDAYNSKYLLAAADKDGCISFWNLYN